MFAPRTRGAAPKSASAAVGHGAAIGAADEGQEKPGVFLAERDEILVNFWMKCSMGKSIEWPYFHYGKLRSDVFWMNFG